MGTNDVLDLDLAARQGLEKLGYAQEMTRVRAVELLSSLVQEPFKLTMPPSVDAWLAPYSFQ